MSSVYRYANEKKISSKSSILFSADFFLSHSFSLQEVDHYKFLATMLATQNYEGIFFPKPDSPCLYITENNGPDGCALFYKKTKFDLVNYDTRVLEVWRVQSNQVTITANLRVIETGKEICVCTTHLKARNGALLAKLRNEQGKVSVPTSDERA